MSRCTTFILLFCYSMVYGQSLDDSIRLKTWQYLTIQDSVVTLEEELEALKLRRIIRDLKAVGIPSEDYITHTAMILDYAEAYKQPAYVLHIITPDIIQGAQFRLDQFRPDPKVISGTAVDEDYFLKELQSDSTYIYDDFGFDRGHMASSTDFRWSAKALQESYYYSNIAPQRAEFNRKAWAEVESWLRSYVYAHTETQLIVFTAPVLEEGLDVIERGEHQVSIPNEFVKAAVDVKNRRGFAVRMPNQEINAPLDSYLTTIDEIEALLELDLFAGLPDSIEQRIEATTDPYQWVPRLVEGYVLPIPPEILPNGYANSRMARNYIGNRKPVTVCGTVVSARYSRSGNLWMNIDNHFPDQVFSILIKKEDLIHFPFEPKTFLMNKAICANGSVVEINETPTMTVRKSQSMTLWDPDE